MMRDIGLVQNSEPARRLFTQGMVIAEGAKMSKSKGNVVGADMLAERFGADTARTYVLFAGPPERDIDWSDEQVAGANRFLRRVWVLAAQHQPNVAGATQDGSAEPGALRRWENRVHAYESFRTHLRDR